MNNKKNILYFISFTEGASVMVTEIGGAKLLAPFYGSSLNVWSAVMAITLGGLAVGYYLGGKFSQYKNRTKTLSLVLILASIALILLPYSVHLFSYIASWFPLLMAVVLSVLVLLFIPMFLMGTTSPLVISMLTLTSHESGKSSGKVYAISTLGGILATFLCALVCIPYFGIKNTFLLFGILLAICSILLHQKSKVLNVLIVISASFLVLASFNKQALPKNYLIEQDGVFGKLVVKEEPSFVDSTVILRKLLINNIVQTEMNVETKQSVSDYIQLLNTNQNELPKDGKVLLLGLGGGLVANLFSENNHQVVGVEFDQRIIDVAKKYFYLNSKIKTVCDDARHFLNNNHETYSIILFDLFHGEEQPSHILTQESLLNLRNSLADNAVVLINWHGYLNGDTGKGTRCLLSTLKNAGFYYKICETNSNEDYRNLLIVASVNKNDLKFSNEIEIPEIEDSVINTDDKPVLELLNVTANQKWRTNYLQNDILNQR